MNQLFFLEMKPESYMALLIGVVCFFLPILVLAIVAFTKLAIKNIKQRKNEKPKQIDLKTKYLSLFGQDNIKKIDKNMSRVTVEVNSLEDVNYDGLRELGVGVLITGNTIKCSSQEFADQIND